MKTRGPFIRLFGILALGALGAWTPVSESDAATIAVSKTRLPGTTVWYDITVRNIGADTITALAISDTVPAEVLPLFTAQPGTLTPSIVGNLVVWDGSGTILAPGASLTVTVVGMEILSLCTAGVGSNTAWIVASGPGGTDQKAAFYRAPGDASTAVTVTPHAVGGCAGDLVTYRIDIVNNGADRLTGVEVIDTISADIEFVSQASPAGSVFSHGGDSCLGWFCPSLQAGEGYSLTITGRIRSGAGPSVANLCVVNASGALCGSYLAVNSVLALGCSLPPPPSPMIEIIGGAEGYIQPDLGERAQILVNPGSTGGDLTVQVVDMAGSEFWRTTRYCPAGITTVIPWDCRNMGGGLVPPGVYGVVVTGVLTHRASIVVVR